ncbi:transferase caf17 [Penicillium riverlandense]|uniref:transferase caf17 n=1 Tax=Penicillium riverlandense TaxID=1903569 RepID=UPI002546F14E|nr:transferase caf17 [Penicillium riverlandense]KAJ5832604.1 transferase caf17 [Penicillium riverlandense]
MMRPRLSACHRCLARSRLFTTTAPVGQHTQNAPPPPPPAAGYARLTNRGLISITGVDSSTFLQGLITQNMLVTNDLSHSVRRTGSYTAFLNSQGRVLNDAFIYPFSGTEEESGWLVEVDKNEIPTLLKHLKKHKLRAKLKLRALEDGERSVWSSWKDHPESRWAAYNLETEASPSPFSTSTVLGCIDSRAPGFGSRLVTPGSEDLRAYLPDETQIPGSEVELASYTVRRMLNGVAEGQTEIIRESALPMECNMDMARGIDFRKGCYVGQELTIRTHHTGVVRKRILPVQLYNQGQFESAEISYDPSVQLALPPGGSNISKSGGRRGRSAGKFLNGVGNIGLALCRLEMMTDIALTGEGTQYTPGQEFKVSWTTDSEQPVEVKLQAFVPSWTRDFIFSGTHKPTQRNTEVDGERARGMVEQLEEEEAQRRTE